MTPAEIISTTDAQIKREGRQVKLDNIRQGTLIAAVYNQHRTKTSDKTLTWKDIFPDTAEKEEQTVDQMKAVCMDIASVYGGKIIRKEVNNGGS